MARKKILVLAEVVDIAKDANLSCFENMPSSVIDCSISKPKQSNNNIGDRLVNI